MRVVPASGPLKRPTGGAFRCPACGAGLAASRWLDWLVALSSDGLMILGTLTFVQLTLVLLGPLTVDAVWIALVAGVVATGVALLCVALATYPIRVRRSAANPERRE